MKVKYRIRELSDSEPDGRHSFSAAAINIITNKN